MKDLEYDEEYDYEGEADFIHDQMKENEILSTLSPEQEEQLLEEGREKDHLKKKEDENKPRGNESDMIIGVDYAIKGEDYTMINGNKIKSKKTKEKIRGLDFDNLIIYE